jgi:SAM-dependent methyltransferase
MIVPRLLERYQQGGFRNVLSGLKARLLLSGDYQEKLDTSFEERWQMIVSAIPEGCGSLLDLGSNLGAFTSRAADEGLIALGLEKDATLLEKATRAQLGAPNRSFMLTELDLETCAKLPTFDVILVLSVHHHWHHAFGPEMAAAMLQSVVGKARQVVLFEGPSRSSRYRSNEPDFDDNDDEAVVAFYDAYLQRTVGRLANRIERLGKADCVGEREPHRWIYAISK